MTDKTLTQAKADCAKAIENCAKLTQAKHTPLPWSVEYDNGRQIVAGTFDDGSTRTVVMSDAIFGDEIANAAFIVRACNSHYELIEALEDARKGITCRNEQVAEYIARIDAAIAKAKGGAA